MSEGSAGFKNLAVKGEQYRLNGYYTEAIECFNEALKIKPDSAWAYAHRGAARAAIDDWSDTGDDFREDFKKATQLRPDYGWAYAHWGDGMRTHASILVFREDWKAQSKWIGEAIEHLNTAFKSSPTSAWILAHRGAAYVYKYWVARHDALYPLTFQDPSDDMSSSEIRSCAELAVSDFEAAIKLNPHYSWAYAFRACIYALMVRFEDKDQPEAQEGHIRLAKESMLYASLLDVNKRLLIEGMIAKLLYFGEDYPEVVGLSASALRKDPWNFYAHFFQAMALKQTEAIRQTDKHYAPIVMERAKKILEGKKSEIEWMLDKLNGLDKGESESFKGKSIEAIAFVSFDPAKRSRTPKPPQPSEHAEDQGSTRGPL